MYGAGFGLGNQNPSDSRADSFWNFNRKWTNRKWPGMRFLYALPAQTLWSGVLRQQLLEFGNLKAFPARQAASPA